jgi:HSP20 family molecular chaperone IbpA
MAKSQALQVQEKKELVSQGEKTVPARYYTPNTDIFETEDSLTVMMELPGIEKKNVDVNIEKGVLRIEGKIDSAKYEGLEPLYTEYSVGHFSRSFTLSDTIDHRKIDAQLKDGVLTLTLNKAKEALPRKIAIN